MFLPKYSAQFYLSQIILAVEYLHSKNIVHRDIKPENLIVNSDGYLKLLDMGAAKILEQNSCRTYTVIGTGHYMAPEVLRGKGYTMYCDLWGIGICFYEFITGYLPFGDESDGPYEIQQEVFSKEIVFPSFAMDNEAKNLVLMLLSKTPQNRLQGSYSNLKNNPWFKDFNWNDVQERKLVPPFVPDNNEKQLKILISEKLEDKILFRNYYEAEFQNLDESSESIY